jgi:hypothetical protein
LADDLDRHLNAISKRLGRLLRGFDDPSFHTGSPDLFAREFRKVFDHPALLPAGSVTALSYAETARRFRVTQPSALGNPGTALSILAEGLAHAPVTVATTLPDLSAHALSQELSALLRWPALLFYVQVSDVSLFFGELEKLAGREKFTLRIAKETGQNSPGFCPACGGALPPGAPSRILQCSACGRAIESIRALSMVSGVAATISYEMLFVLLASSQVVSYQEEGDIRHQ